jgi:hypothetical protein
MEYILTNDQRIRLIDRYYESTVAKFTDWFEEEFHVSIKKHIKHVNGAPVVDYRVNLDSDEDWITLVLQF